ncbi:Flavin reductase like domain protein [Calidithermus terrae]|uniref:Flavin reductase like domain protein n=1 Tax=Calidithermus terrae TaxID=1408545 RepID=A0A399EQR4_9DEIN|nr:flavin reductase family protein [Calidithermus terrae]RIH86987.1 Flavin reductase like domain protein [Calidithermus terrae]
MEFDFARLKPQERYKLLTALVVPRPIAWVTTLNPDGSVNAAPFSFFNVMGSDPGVLVISVGNHGRARPKDTAANIRRSGFFVVQMVSEELAEAMNLTATEFPEGVSEVAVAGLELAPSAQVPVPRIARAPAGFECKLHSVLEIGRNRLVIGEVLHAFVQDEFIADAERYHVKTEALRLIGRMHGRGGYTRTREIFEMPRVSYEEWQARQAEKA